MTINEALRTLGFEPDIFGNIEIGNYNINMKHIERGGLSVLIDYIARNSHAQGFTDAIDMILEEDLNAPISLRM